MLPPDIANTINAIFDEVLDLYFADGKVIFDSVSERKKLQYRMLERRMKEWNRRKTCIFRGCNNKSIRRSHSIQKSGPLKAISFNSTILTPEFNQSLGEIVLASKGLSVASTFPGYCEGHERLFSVFEEQKKLEGHEAIGLQIYRSICREVVRLEVEVELLEDEVKKYKEFRNNKFLKLISKRLGPNWLKDNDVSLKSVNFDNDPFLIRSLEGIAGLRDTLSKLKSHHLSELEQIVDGGSNRDVHPVVIKIDIVVPVTLSGIGSFHVRDSNGNTCKVIAVLGIYPDSEDESTTIIVHGSSKDTKFIHWYVGQQGNSFDVLNMLEQFMIRGTDHWFLSPQAWSVKSPAERKSILAEIQDAARGLGHELNFSVFDELRREMISAWEESGNLGATELSVLERESAKLRVPSDDSDIANKPVNPTPGRNVALRG